MSGASSGVRGGDAGPSLARGADVRQGFPRAENGIVLCTHLQRERERGRETDREGCLLVFRECSGGGGNGAVRAPPRRNQVTAATYIEYFVLTWSALGCLVTCGCECVLLLRSSDRTKHCPVPR